MYVCTQAPIRLCFSLSRKNVIILITKIHISTIDINDTIQRCSRYPMNLLCSENICVKNPLAEHDDLDKDLDVLDNSVEDGDSKFIARRKLLTVNPSIIRCRKDRRLRSHYHMLLSVNFKGKMIAHTTKLIMMNNDPRIDRIEAPKTAFDNIVFSMLKIIRRDSQPRSGNRWR